MPSDLQLEHDGNYHWFTGGLLAYHAGGRLAHQPLERRHRVLGVVDPLGDRLVHRLGCLAQDGLGIVHQAVTVQVGAEYHVGLPIDPDGHHHDALVGEVTPITQAGVLDVSVAGTVEVDVARRHRPSLHLRGVAGEDDPASVLQDVHLGYARRPGEVGVSSGMAVLAVHRDESAGTDDIQEGEEFLAGGVTRDMHGGVAPVHHPSTSPGQATDHLRHSRFITRDRLRRDENGVVLAYLDELVASTRHEGESGERLTLASGGHQHLLLGGKLQQVTDVHDPILRQA